MRKKSQKAFFISSIFFMIGRQEQHWPAYLGGGMYIFFT